MGMTRQQLQTLKDVYCGTNLHNMHSFITVTLKGLLSALHFHLKLTAERLNWWKTVF